MGYMLAMGPCMRCRRVFSFNPHKVPSQRLQPDGPRQPVCRACFDYLNRKRVKLGYERWPDPLPGAYEPGPEDEI